MPSPNGRAEMNSTKYELIIDPEITLWSMDYKADRRRTEAYRRQTMRRLASYLENHGATCEEVYHGLHLRVTWVGDVEMRKLAEVAIQRFLRGYGEIVEEAK